jgi:hypothetical protein
MNMPSAARLGEGEFSYTVEDWAQLPESWSIGDVGGVAVDALDNVYVFHRGVHPMLVFDRDGRFLRSWGEGLFTRPHGLHIAADQTVWCTDDGDHTVRHARRKARFCLRSAFRTGVLPI